VFVAWLTQLLCDTMAPKYLVGFNSKHYDEPVLNRCLGARVFNGVVHLDVLDIVYRFYPELEQHKLGFLYQHFFGRPLEGAHDASADVLATLDILEAVLVDLEKTKAQMAEEMAVPKPYDIFPISKKYKGWRSSQVPKSMARWLLETSAKEDNPLRPDLLATVEMILKQ
jgi:DNA polymerase III epsilon subunit-like protein